MRTTSTHDRHRRRGRPTTPELQARSNRAAEIARNFQAVHLEQQRRNAAAGRCCTKCLRGTRAMNYGCARYGDCACHRKKAA